MLAADVRKRTRLKHGVRLHMRPHDFYLRVAYVLSGCQLVEQELKLYISEALELVQKCVAGRVAFTMSGDDYKDTPLGRLIDTFKKLSDNTALVAELRKFKTERDFLSHKDITRCLDPDGELDDAVTQFGERLSKVRPEAERLCTAIHEEANKFRGHLWFGEWPDAG
jgi:hypothetical protein